MEYPPRKFHPLRKPVTGGVSYLQAKVKGMINACKGIGIELFDPQERERLESEQKRLEGDLIENIPHPDWKLKRRQNMIHRDLDPSNSLLP